MVDGGRCLPLGKGPLPSYGGLDLCNELFLLHRAVAHAGWSREGFLRVRRDFVAEQAGAIVRRRVLLQVA